MRSLGLEGYRFSIAWPRIQPDGRGPANQRGLDFYRALVEGLLERGIGPLATLYHWDLPQALEDEGGWASRDVVERFAEYAAIVFDALGDLVADWITHNEPWVTSFLGYAYGVEGAGRHGLADARCAPRTTRCSPTAPPSRLTATGGGTGKIGITLDLTVANPATALARGRRGRARALDGHHNRWFLDPVFRGSYPADMVELYEERLGPLDVVQDGDLELIAQPIDFLGVNFYRPNVVEAADDDSVLGLARASTLDAEHTAMGWPIVPSALTELLVRLERDYGGVPFLITENGAAFDDQLDGGDVVEDERRVAYIAGHIEARRSAPATQGVDVRGYYVWSLLDNFEWEYGYEKRFGIVFVDFPTQRRDPEAERALVPRPDRGDERRSGDDGEDRFPTS